MIFLAPPGHGQIAVLTCGDPFRPKGKRISDYSNGDILAVELWANSLPRKVLDYKTPNEAFEEETDKIYAA